MSEHNISGGGAKTGLHQHPEEALHFSLVEENILWSLLADFGATQKWLKPSLEKIGQSENPVMG